jgi:hypothetical protein
MAFPFLRESFKIFCTHASVGIYYEQLFSITILLIQLTYMRLWPFQSFEDLLFP